jgi:hypothetical protein
MATLVLGLLVASAKSFYDTFVGFCTLSFRGNVYAPYTGMIGISGAPLHTALAQLGR